MFKNETFRIFLISIIFTAAFLFALPRIPVFVNNKYLRLDSYIGGYEFKVSGASGERVIDLKDFKKGTDIGGSQKIIYKVEAGGVDDVDTFINNIINITVTRLNSVGILDFQVGIENKEEGLIYVLTSANESYDRLSNLIIGTGEMSFMYLKEPDSWNMEEYANFYLEYDRWVRSDVNEKDVQFLRFYTDSRGFSQLQITFNLKGKEKFFSLAENNLNRPIGIFINGYEYPLTMPLISEALLNDPSADPVVSGGFTKQLIDDFILQMKNPLPATLTYVETINLGSKMGSDFLQKYLSSFMIGILITFCFFIIKYKNFGIIYSVSVVFSLVIFASILKILQIPISVPTLIGTFLFIIFLFDIGIIVLEEINKGIKEKPLDLLLHEIFIKRKDTLGFPTISIFLISLVLYFITYGKVKSFMLALSVSMFVSIFYYSFLLRNFLEAFGRNKK